MSEEQAGAGPEPGSPGEAAEQTADPHRLPLSLAWIGTDVGTFAPAVAGQPDQVGARLDVDGPVTPIAVRLGALGSALDQMRLALLGALDRTTDRVDQPVWLADLLTAVDTLGARIDATAGSRVDDQVAAMRAQVEGAIEALSAVGTRVEGVVARIPGPEPMMAALAQADPAPSLAALQNSIADLTEAMHRDLGAITDLLAAEPTTRSALAEQTEQTEQTERTERTEQTEQTDSMVVGRFDAVAGRLDRLEAALQHRIDQATARLDQPLWLPALQAAVAELAVPDPSIAEPAPPVPDAPAPDPRLDDLLEVVRRLDAGAGPALDDVSARLAALERAGHQAAEDAKLLAERVMPIADRLGAIAVQVDRITPLARAGDEAGSLIGQLDRVHAGLDQVIAHLVPKPDEQAAGAASGETEGSGDEVDARFDAVVDVLAGVTRRQDEVTAAVASALDREQGPMGVDAVLDRMEQRERSLAARLDRIDAGLRAQNERPPNGGQLQAAEADRVLRAVLDVVERQGRAFTARLDQLDADLRSAVEHAVRATAEPPADPALALALAAILERLDQQEKATASHLGWVGDRLAEVAVHLVPAEHDDDQPAPGAAEEPHLAAIVAALGDLARRQDQLAALVTSASGVGSPGPDPARAIAPPARRDPAARLAELRAERARVQARLRQERLLAAQVEDQGTGPF